MLSNPKKQLYISIVNFLASELSNNGYSDDTIESLEGNHCMTEEKFHEAVTCYSKAIELDPHNAVYFCNRAAANSRLNNHDESIRDCERAVAIDPNYSKAYGRMGLAYSNKGNIPKAIDCYKKAISLDPNNKNFQENLSIAEARLQDSDAGSGPEVGLGGPGGLNLGALFASPAMQDLARQFVSDPNLQNTVSSMMQGMLGGGVIPGATGGGRAPGNAEPAAHGGSDGPPTANPNIAAAPLDNLLRIQPLLSTVNAGLICYCFFRSSGQQFAQQMQQSNPDLVSTLRQRMQDVTGQPPGDGTNDHNSSGN
ncbi:unnamed protein product [Schistocephalus solidus]|uniref:TPR_REGION domain-containing protein n=1 Tax=Schistocephalus solidus TaxID=70667 RepID=A0A183T597_SCHSO|nr:unnamed protein product [Schistocephalus solidus]